MDPLTNPAFIVFAALSPLLIAFIKQQGFSPQINSIIVLVGYFAVGILGALVSGTPFTIEHVIDFVAIGSVVGTAAYNILYSNLMTGAIGTAPSLDQRLTDATSIVH